MVGVLLYDWEEMPCAVFIRWVMCWIVVSIDWIGPGGTPIL